MIQLLKIFLLVLLSNTLAAQLVINEVASNNETIIQDEFGDYTDWIELYNSGDTPLDMSNYYLSDEADFLLKWQLPAIILAPQDFLLVFASNRALFATYPHTNFKLSADGEAVFLSTSGASVVDQILIPTLDDDISYGRYQDGLLPLVYFENATPNASNNNSVSFSDIAFAPNFSIKEAFHDTTIELNLTCQDNNCQVYYTTDGSLPSDASTAYTEAILIEKTTTIRAITYSEDQLPSPLTTQTYFINTQHELPVISISTNPELLYDEIDGIFRWGPDAEEEWPHYGANFWKDIEIPVHFEFYENDKSLAYTHEVGCKVHGGTSARTPPLKPLRLLAKNKYGIENMYHTFLPDRKRTLYKRLVIRNASGDFYWGYIRDPFLQKFSIQEAFEVDVLAARPSAVYINGAYHGLMYLREKSDEYYISNNYHIPVENLDVLEEDDLIVNGNFDVFDEMYDYVVTHDLAEAAHYAQAQSYFDIKSLSDIFAIQTIVNNVDWPHNNIKYWRERKAGAKWRYIMFDMDIAMDGRGWAAEDINSWADKMVQYHGENKHVNLIQAFLNNNDFKNYFINRYADLLNTSFRPTYLRARLDEFTASIDNEIQQHFQRWDYQTYDKWQNVRLPIIYDFINQRPAFARQYLQAYFELENQVNLQLNVYPPEAGTIKINTISPESLPWDGIYYNGVPVNISIEANAGYTFQYWQSLHHINAPNSSPSIIYNFEKDDAITAYFTASDYGGLDLQIAPNPIANSTTLQCSFLLEKINTVSFSIYNIKGQLMDIPLSEKLYNAGLQKINLPLNKLSAGTYFLKIKTASEQATTPFVVF